MAVGTAGTGGTGTARPNLGFGMLFGLDGDPSRSKLF